MAKKKVEWTPASIVFLSIIVISIVFTIGALIKSFFPKKNAFPTTSAKINEQDYKQWVSICDKILIGIEEQKFLLVAKNFNEFTAKIHSIKKPISDICAENKTTLKHFLFVCKNLNMARSYYMSVDKLREDERSVFPADLLPEGVEKPEPEPVITEKDFKEMDDAQEHNIKLYVAQRETIENIITELCSF